MRPGPEASVNNEFMIFGGTANPNVGAAIARELGTGVGACVVDRYPDGDAAVQLLESVRRKEVFLVQPTSPPVNDHLVELRASGSRRCLPPRRRLPHGDRSLLRVQPSGTSAMDWGPRGAGG